MPVRVHSARKGINRECRAHVKPNAECTRRPALAKGMPSAPKERISTLAKNAYPNYSQAWFSSFTRCQRFFLTLRFSQNDKDSPFCCHNVQIGNRKPNVYTKVAARSLVGAIHVVPVSTYEIPAMVHSARKGPYCMQERSKVILYFFEGFHQNKTPHICCHPERIAKDLFPR